MTAVIARVRRMVLILAPGTMTDMAISAKSVAHIRLTVTDIDRSRRFYEAVFGWPVALEVPADADDATREQLGFLFGGVLYNVGDFLVRVLEITGLRSALMITS